MEGRDEVKGAKNPTAGDTPPSDTPLRNSRPSIQAKAKSLVDLVLNALVDLVVNADASSEAVYLMRASEAARSQHEQRELRMTEV